jgi:hypothetical protein
MADFEGSGVRTTIIDRTNNMTYHVVAYRSLSEDEMVLAVRMYHAHMKNRRRKKPERNKEITIYSLLELND